MVPSWSGFWSKCYIINNLLTLFLIFFIYFFFFSFFFWFFFFCIFIFLRKTTSLKLQKHFTDPRIMRISFVLFQSRCHSSSDSLVPHRDFVFSTWHRDPAGCALKSGGCWWYGNSSKCAVWSNLSGIYPRCGNKT